MKTARTDVRLWILSDLHLELTRGWDLPGPAERPAFDVLIIAGDLVPKMERGVRWLIERVDKPCIYVPGNHEFYGCDVDRTVEKARAAAAGSQIHILQNDAVDLGGGITFLGATLWTDFDLFGDAEYAMMAAGDTMNDYRKIRTHNYRRQLRPAHTLKRNLESRDFIARELRKGGRNVVVTHHGPVPQAARRGFERDISSAAYWWLTASIHGSGTNGRIGRCLAIATPASTSSSVARSATNRLSGPISKTSIHADRADTTSGWPNRAMSPRMFLPNQESSAPILRATPIIFRVNLLPSKIMNSCR
ncbi:MAG TPA: metallophosphoesterase [Beijerinckiaceae bacterium]|nr:metallophosphoesterase [Beijerinckiaceae bacterium]